LSVPYILPAPQERIHKGILPKGISLFVSQIFIQILQILFAEAS
jgi:hypothetical protein